MMTLIIGLSGPQQGVGGTGRSTSDIAASSVLLEALTERSIELARVRQELEELRRQRRLHRRAGAVTHPAQGLARPADAIEPGKGAHGLPDLLDGRERRALVVSGDHLREVRVSAAELAAQHDGAHEGGLPRHLNEAELGPGGIHTRGELQ